MLNFLQDLSETELRKEVYICGSDCIVNIADAISITEDSFIDDFYNELPANHIVIEWYKKYLILTMDPGCFSPRILSSFWT